MKPTFPLTALLCMMIPAQVLAQAQEMDKELSDLAERITTLVKEQNIKKITILDFTDLQGGTSELGRYIAEQISVDLVQEKQPFSVLDRAHLNRILAEHQLTATGLVNPQNAKKLGMFAGVDAFIFGTVTAKDPEIVLTAKIISTETAEVVRAAKGKFRIDKDVQKLMSRATLQSAAGPGGTSGENGAKATAQLRELRVDLRSLRKMDDDSLFLTMTLFNQDANNSIWVAINGGIGHEVKGIVTDSAGFVYRNNMRGATGVAVDSALDHRSPGTEIKPGESIPVTVGFAPMGGARPAPGTYDIQLEFLLGHNLNTANPNVAMQNLLAKISLD